MDDGEPLEIKRQQRRQKKAIERQVSSTLDESQKEVGWNTSWICLNIVVHY